MKETTEALMGAFFSHNSELIQCRESIEAALQTLSECFRSGGKLLTCGNGGSASDAQHIVGELMKSFTLPRTPNEKLRYCLEEASCNSIDYLVENLQGALPALSLVGETSLTTAYSNDMAPGLVFAQQVYGYGHAGDVLFAISTSGESKNILYAAQVAKALKMNVIGLTGEKGGALRDWSDVLIAVPSNETYRVQEYHLPVYHMLCLALENEFFGDN